jgi:hypothetical protein
MERVIDLVFDIFTKLEKNQQRLSIQYILILLHCAIVILYVFEPNIIHLNTKVIEAHKFDNKSMETKSLSQKMELQVRNLICWLR